MEPEHSGEEREELSEKHRDWFLSRRCLRDSGVVMLASVPSQKGDNIEMA